jgi:hypothetical protein
VAPVRPEPDEARTAELRGAALNPQSFVRRFPSTYWCRLSEEERGAVIIAMDGHYDPAFTFEFTRFANEEALHEGATLVRAPPDARPTAALLFTYGLSYTYDDLWRPYRGSTQFGGCANWIYPNGVHLAICPARTDEPESPPPPEEQSIVPGLPARLPPMDATSFGGAVATATNVDIELVRCEQATGYRDETFRCQNHGEWTTYVPVPDSAVPGSERAPPAYIVYDSQGRQVSSYLLFNRFPLEVIREAGRGRR